MRGDASNELGAVVVAVLAATLVPVVLVLALRELAPAHEHTCPEPTAAPSVVPPESPVPVEAADATEPELPVPNAGLAPATRDTEADALCDNALRLFGYRVSHRARGAPLWARPLAKATCRRVSLEAVSQGIPAEVAVAVAVGESHLNASALGADGEVGAMQVKGYHCGPLLGRECQSGGDAIDVGVRYLAELLDSHDGDTRDALAAYNCGPAGARRPHVRPTCLRYADRALDRAERLADASAARP